MKLITTSIVAAVISVLAQAASAGTYNVAGTLTPGGPQEPQVAGISTPNCNGSYTAFAVLYQSFPFTVDTTGSYQFSESGLESAVYVYANNFNPSLPADNCIAASNTNPISGLSVNLTAGTQYYYVVIEDTFAQDGMSINGSISGPGNIFGPAVAGTVPTMSEWGLISLSGLLALGGAFAMRRRQDSK
jgi:hypothetical protein